MAKDTHELYKGPTLHKIFAISSILFLLGVIWMVAADHNREWKKVQRQFESFERDKTQKEIERAARKIDDAKRGELAEQLAKLNAEFEGHKGDFRSIQTERDKVRDELFKTSQSYQIAKSYFDSTKYEFEQSQRGGHLTEALKKQLEETREKAETLELEKARLELQQDSLDAKLNSFTEEQEETKKEIIRLTRDYDLLEKNLKNLKPGIVKFLLNAPLLDFIQPTLKIRQIVLDELYDDYHFAKVPKVDRCTTCHLAIDVEKGYGKAPQPFASHPRLDLFLGSKSPHPIEQFGCTVCHGGSGQDVSFAGSAHTPRNEDQEKEWVEKYGWKERHYWEFPMLSLDRVEANCVKCHDALQEIPEAPKINQGRRLFREMGCFGCHETKGFEGLRKVGPSLRRIGSKADRGWVFSWIKNPQAFNPTTRMPRFFGLSNAASQELEDVEVDAVVDYLFRHSEDLEIGKTNAQGNAERGQQLVGEIGCLGCHTVGDKAANQFGPNLSWVGSKASRVWLLDWLKNPKHYWAETRMPNMRLSDDEALDIAEYLMKLKNSDFEQKAEPIINDEILDQATLHELELQMSKDLAAEKIKSMDEPDKKLFLGERVIRRYGCYGCHDIPGFEDAKPIGTNLSEEGSKPTARFDFGLLDIPESREAWFIQKLKDPRSFDHGKIKRHEELLRMPKFNLTDEEIQALVTHLTSLTKEEIPLSKKHVLDDREQKIEQGWRLVRDQNCQGCHIVNGEGGRILDLYEDKSLGPPNITGEGKKVQSQWLFNFLRHPTPIRPWLKVRMPTFGFADEKATTLVKFFHGLDDVEDTFVQDDAAHPSVEQITQGKQVFESLQCIKCHRFQKGDVIDASMDVSNLAPNLSMANRRLRHDWIIAWLNNPEPLLPGTRMPSFWPDGVSPVPEIMNGDANLQMTAVRDYVVSLESDSPPSNAQAQ